MLGGVVLCCVVGKLGDQLGSSAQNLISFGLGYANVDSTEGSSDHADYGYWDSLPAVYEDKHVRHVQVEHGVFT